MLEDSTSDFSGSTSLLSEELKENQISKKQKRKVIVISGPTASGKTELSLLLAQLIAGEIVSADSMQVYRGMDIGTAKVSKSIQAKIPHHLIDIREIDEPFNVVDFYEAALHSFAKIIAANHVPIVVGGTGFYIHSLLFGPPLGPPSVPTLRVALEKEMDKFGAELLYDKLQKLDPEYAQTITKGDRQKIIRALEIMSLTNQKVSAFKISPHTMKFFQNNYDFRCWFVYFPRNILYPRIESRCEEMIAKGLLEEVKELEKKGLRKNSTASQAIGYKQCLEYLESNQTEEDWNQFVVHFKTASRRYAKRQFTWFRGEPHFRWLNLDEVPLEKAVETVIQDYEQSF